MSNKHSDTALEALQDWYHSNCDGDWEHEYSIKIENVDNPGWSVSIPIAGTSLESRPFREVRWKRSTNEWLICRVDGLSFLGDGGSRNLVDIVRVFLEWARGS